MRGCRGSNPSRRWPNAPPRVGETAVPARRAEGEPRYPLGRLSPRGCLAAPSAHPPRGRGRIPQPGSLNAGDGTAAARCARPSPQGDGSGDEPPLYRFGRAPGTSPVVYQSGKVRRVHRRRACDKHVRQTLHPLAWTSMIRCAWARASDDAYRARGHGHRAALRALWATSGSGSCSGCGRTAPRMTRRALSPPAHATGLRNASAARAPRRSCSAGPRGSVWAPCEAPPPGLLAHDTGGLN